MQVNIKNLIDDSQCYQTVRELRWPDGIKCPWAQLRVRGLGQDEQGIKASVDPGESQV